MPTVFVIGALLGFTRSVEGAPVYSQALPAEPSAAFSSQDISTGPIVADNFIFDGATSRTIRSLRLIGARTDTDDPQPQDAFRVVFLEDSSGSPGTSIAGGDFGTNSFLRQTATGGQLLNGLYVPLEYEIDLGAGISLNPGVEYWVTIMNNLGPGHGWVWGRAQGDLDSQIASTFSSFSNSSWIVGSSGGMFFELSDQNIPEPTSFMLLFTSLATTTFFRNSYLRS